MRAYLADWYEMFAHFSAVPEEFINAGPGRVIVVWHLMHTGLIPSGRRRLRRGDAS
jgi:hypothetical protein